MQARVAMESVDKNLARSCVVCAKAKAKCVRKPGAQICERCARLNKECLSKEPVLRRKKPMKTTRTAQLEKLESKIEHLVNALSTQQANRAAIDYGQQSPAESHTSPAAPQTGTRTHEVLSSLCSAAEGSEAAPTNAISIPTTDAIKTKISAEEANTLLDRYRRLMSTGMPFVIVPESMTAAELFIQKPVLLGAICAVTLFHDLARQQRLIKELNRQIAERMFVKNEKSLDLLQGILVLVGWLHPHIFWCPQTTNLLHLASALTIDLGIDRHPTQCADFKQATTKAVHGPNLVQKVHTLEERRALMGVFYLTNMLSSSFRKLDTMPFTSYMKEALSSLEQAREHDSDLFLVQMVRIQCVIEQIHTSDVPNAPAKVYIRAFQADLDGLRRSDPCKEDNVFLRMHYLAAEILMWELSLSELQEKQSRGRSLTSHLEDLYRCVGSIKAFFDAYFTISTSAYYLLPYTVFGHFAHVFICMTKLASLDVDGWDFHALNEQIDFISVVEECAKRFEDSTREKIDGMSLENDSLSKWAGKIRWMKQVYETKFAQDGAATQPQSMGGESVRTAETPGQQPTPPDDPVMSADFFNYLDEDFWNTFSEMDPMLFPGVEVS